VRKEGMDKKFDFYGAAANNSGDKQVRHTGVFIRLLARILDVIVLVAIINILFSIDNLGGNRGWWSPLPIPGWPVFSGGGGLVLENIIRGIFYGGIHPLYYILMHAKGGQTLGKMAFRIKVVTIDGQDITMGQSILRWVGYLLCDVTLGIGYLLIPFTRLRQGLHDKIAQTTVMYLQR
jgi:uncharacterized RDD family membrane protein YckC